MNLPSSSFWEISGVILAVIAIIITVLFYFLQLKRKKLTYYEVYQSQLLPKQEDLTNRIQILFDGNSVDNVSINVIRISNSGNIPITSNDFEHPLIIELDGATTILSIDVVRTNPKKLTASYNIKDNTIKLEPLLLNPDDFIVLKILSSGIVKQIKVNARVVGVQEITIENDPRKQVFTNMGLFSLFTMLISFLVLAKFKQQPSVGSVDAVEAIALGSWLIINLIALRFFNRKIDDLRFKF